MAQILPSLCFRHYYPERYYCTFGLLYQGISANKDPLLGLGIILEAWASLSHLLSQSLFLENERKPLEGCLRDRSDKRGSR